jgi:4-amino-4-deoxy-L-arabinose transferase-like glycosyltransferase
MATSRGSREVKKWRFRVGRSHLGELVIVLLALVAVLRTVRTYDITAQGFDEPCHIAAALEWLDRHTYKLDPVHPPLARVAIGLPLLLAGERYPSLASDDPGTGRCHGIGNDIIYGSGHFARDLALGRSGMIPFLVLEIVLVFLWARRELGEFAGALAAALFSTLPIVLAFAGLAYTDLPASCMQFAAFFAFATWLDKPTTGSSVWLGIAAGFALLSKLTILIFFPAVAVALVVCKLLLGRHSEPLPRIDRRAWAGRALMAGAIAIVVLWAGYGFSIGHVRESMQLTAENMPSFRHFPGPMRSIARDVVISNWALPAPAFLKGLTNARALNKSMPLCYIFGRIKAGGWWYFFLVAVAVKTPLPFLILCMVGLVALVANKRERRWQTLAPALCAIATLVVTMGVSYDAGVRHVLVVFPLLAVVGGFGAAYLWELPGRARFGGKALLAALLLWQGLASFAARSDYIAYFNPLAGKDPSRVLISGCDLDCGQDVYRLANELRAQHASHVYVAMWSSAELAYMGLPETEVLPPFHPVTGWVAVSARSLRLGEVFNTIYPPHAFDWLEPYPPKEWVGKTIRLYYVPPDTPANNAAEPKQSQ